MKSHFVLCLLKIIKVMALSKFSIFIVTLGSSAFLPAFSLTINPLGPVGAINTWVPTDIYNLGGGAQWRVNLNPTFLSPIDKAGRDEFKKFLDESVFGKPVGAGGQGWKFDLSPNPLKGSFNILNYAACAPQTVCKSNLGPPREDKVGAFIDIEYKPGEGDPPLGFDKNTLNGIHWIQRVKHNHKLPSPPNKHGDKVDIIDNNGNIANPYYDSVGTSKMDKGLFADRPTRGDKGNAHQDPNWIANLFLVQQTAPKTVTIWDGVNWGWTNFCEKPAKPKSLFLSQDLNGEGSCQDFGDAPDSYKTLLNSQGPRYQEGNFERLGILWDSEADGQPTILSNGDDILAACGLTSCFLPDDEDGVVFGDSWVDVTFNIRREGSNIYQLRAWWDLDNNGSFDHPSELSINDLLTLSPTIYTKRYSLGFDPKLYYSRFRLTLDPADTDVMPFGEYFPNNCSSNVEQTGCTSYGEVEDYAPAVPGPLPILGLVAFYRYARKLRTRLR